MRLQEYLRVEQRVFDSGRAWPALNLEEGQVSLEALQGREYGPRPFRVCADKVAEFVLATGDDTSRWINYAPPGFAAVPLFAVAPDFLEEPEVVPFTRILIHADQTFRWHLPWTVEETLSVRGTVERVRSRGAQSFVTFGIRVDNTAGRRVLDAQSTFLMSSDSPARAAAEEPEPSVMARAANEPLTLIPMPASGQPHPDIARSASRYDLVRYAGATRDWNPIHFDHEAAVAAGLPGIVVHGLLMAAWAAQAGTRLVDHPPRPLAEARFRFRAPLRPGRPATVSGMVEKTEDTGVQLKVRVLSEGIERVTSTIVLART